MRDALIRQWQELSDSINKMPGVSEAAPSKPT